MKANQVNKSITYITLICNLHNVNNKECLKKTTKL